MVAIRAEGAAVVVQLGITVTEVLVLKPQLAGLTVI
jgi:hypothetical protein